MSSGIPPRGFSIAGPWISYWNGKFRKRISATILISVENYSDIRRQHGSGIATHVMENTGLRMKSHLCEEDSIFRCETDEPAVLVTHLHSPEDAASLAESLLAPFTEPNA
ncbi:MAG: diguanylate cyclase [Spirochaetaceae bacterium]|nr:diguanylate cyclase [Spirochaetaceae bacterium]